MLHYFQLLVPSQPMADSEKYEHVHHGRKVHWTVLLYEQANRSEPHAKIVQSTVWSHCRAHQGYLSWAIFWVRKMWFSFSSASFSKKFPLKHGILLKQNKIKESMFSLEGQVWDKLLTEVILGPISSFGNRSRNEGWIAERTEWLRQLLVKTQKANANMLPTALSLWWFLPLYVILSPWAGHRVTTTCRISEGSSLSVPQFLSTAAGCSSKEMHGLRKVKSMMFWL